MLQSSAPKNGEGGPVSWQSVSGCETSVLEWDKNADNDNTVKRPKAAKDDFQGGQTAKARLGSPCAVTPRKTGTWLAFDSDEEASLLYANAPPQEA